MLHYQWGNTHLELVQGNIVAQTDVDALVNAANQSLLGAGGVDGAIHAAAGPELLAECRTLGGCPVGEARITKAYRLPVRALIHTVGPVYRSAARINWDGDSQVEERPEAGLLAQAYRSSLRLASEHGLKRIALPSLSTGAYAYPLDQAAPIALNTVRACFDEFPSLELVRFVLWDGQAMQAFRRAAFKLFGSPA
jgi:O-acetyl-ADP-ribose deacetylase (regulator of RNase III)